MNDRSGPEVRSAVSARLPELDALRALAVFAVLGSHFGALGKLDDLRGALPVPVLEILRIWERSGWLGVDLFFVLSGFLVSGLLFREHSRHGSIDGRAFFLRRGLKIYPAFYTFLTITAAMQLTLTVPPPWLVFRARLVGEACFVQNYYASLWHHTWTLAVEEHFYALLLILAMVLARLGRGKADPFRPLPAITAVVAVAVLGCRVVLGYVIGYADSIEKQELLTVWTHTRIDSLLFGVLLSYSWHHHAERTRRWLANVGALPWLIAVAGILPALMWDRHLSHGFIQTFGFTLQYLAFGSLLLAVMAWGSAAASAKALRLLAPVSFVGRHSYSVYLWHEVVAVYGGHYFQVWTRSTRLVAIEIPLYLAASVIAGIVMSLLVEQPVLRVRERWIPSRNSGGGIALGALTSQTAC